MLTRQVHSVGKLHVHVKSAQFKNVSNYELIGKIDPYIKVSLFNEVHTTRIHDNTEAPNFDEEFQVTSVAARGVQLVVEAWDKDMISDDDIIGKGFHDVEDKVYSGMPMDVTVYLRKEIKGEGEGGGEAAVAAPATAAAEEEEAAGGADDGMGTVQLRLRWETSATVNLNDAKIESLLNLFLVLDANENGTIDTDEFAALGKAMTGRKQSKDYVLSQMRKADSNRDDCLDVAEFIKFSEVLGTMNEKVFANTINNYTKKLVRERERRRATEDQRPRGGSFFF